MAILIVNLALIMLFVVVFIFFYIRDSEYQKRLFRYEKSLDDLNKELYKMHKFIKDNANKNTSVNNIDYEKIIKNELKNIHDLINKDRKYVDGKIAKIEEKVKASSVIPSGFGSSDDRKILSMFKDGWSIESIARELRISKSEVEFTLKLAEIG